MNVEIGKSAPKFKLSATGGYEISSETLIGKNIVIYFYPKDDTPGCTLESCGFRDAYSEFQRLNTEILGVSKDSLTSHEKFKKKYELPFPLLVDENSTLSEEFGVWQEKSMYGKTYWGIQRSTFLIDPHGILRKVWRNVKVPGHVEDVLISIEQINT